MGRVIDIGMLGASGTGKTSLLASMYAEFLNGIEGTHLALEPADSITSGWLQLRRSELEQISREIVVRESGIPGNAESRTLRLALNRTDKGNEGTHLELQFTDYPGGWLFRDDAQGGLAPGAASADEAELRERLADSPIVIVSVDTPALIWNNGYYHQGWNRPQQVAELLREWLSAGAASGSDRSLVIFVPIKCEKWVQSPNEAETQTLVRDLDRKVRAGYPEARKILAQNPEVTVACAPIQTVGALVHDRFEVARESRTVESRFRGRSASGRYEPAWTVEPLRLALRESIKHRIETRGFWEEIASWFGHHADLKEAVQLLERQSGGHSFVWQP